MRTSDVVTDLQAPHTRLYPQWNANRTHKQNEHHSKPPLCRKSTSYNLLVQWLSAMSLFSLGLLSFFLPFFLSFCLSVCLSVFLSFCFSVFCFFLSHLQLYLSIYLSFYLSSYLPSIHPSVRPSVCVSVCLSITICHYLSIPIYLLYVDWRLKLGQTLFSWQWLGIKSMLGLCMSPMVQCTENNLLQQK